MRVPYDRMVEEFTRVLKKCGFDARDASRAAELFAQASLDGVYTHGLNRFASYVHNAKTGAFDVNARASLAESCGMLERWDGHMGPGNLNAAICMERAIALAQGQGIGCVALRHTTHWLRPGAYGLMAADAGMIGICFTNTMVNMTPWGGAESKLGNNPLVICVPNGDSPVLLDIAMSQFSYGKLSSYAASGALLPVEGGLGTDGQPTRDPARIIQSHNAAPIGLWKGSGLSLMLDLLAFSLSGGSSTREIGKIKDTDVSQVFVAIHIAALPDAEQTRARIADTLADLNAAQPLDPAQPVRYPGQGRCATRRDQLEHGVLCRDDLWNEVLAL